MKFSDRAKEIIGTVAPVLGETLGGPLWGLAAHFLSQQFGVESTDQKALEEAVLKQSPESIEKIRLAAIDLQKHASDNELDLERINAQDRSSARDREIKTGDSWTPRVLAAAVTIVWGLVQYHVMTHVIAPEMKELAARMMGTLDAILMVVYGYYFGSSLGAKHMRETIASTVPKN